MKGCALLGKALKRGVLFIEAAATSGYIVSLKGSRFGLLSN